MHELRPRKAVSLAGLHRGVTCAVMKVNIFPQHTKSTGRALCAGAQLVSSFVSRAMAEPLALRAWLLTRASVHESRVDELVRVLAAEWVHDVPTLLKTLHALERALPAAAFVALKEAADAEAQETPITDPPPPVQVPDEDDGPPPPYANTPPPLPLQGDHHLLRASREREREAAERQQALKAEVRRYRRVLRRARSCAIHPSSSWLRVWDVIAVAPCLMWTVAVTPFEVGFLSLAVDELWYANRAVDGLLLLDVALHFFVAYREPRDAKLITSLPLIASRYASSWLVVDVLSCVPLELGVRLLAASLLGLPPHEPLPSHAATFCRLAALVRALKLLRLTRLSRLIARWESPMTHLPYAAVRIGWVVDRYTAGGVPLDWSITGLWSKWSAGFPHQSGTSAELRRDSE